MPILTVKRYAREEIRANPDYLYIFGDNYERMGMGGQAKEARGEPNVVGVRTKRKATYGEDAFLTDNTYAYNCSAIINDFGHVLEYLKNGGTVVWPADGIGTGLANLKQNAPKTLEFIESIISNLKSLYGEV